MAQVRRLVVLLFVFFAALVAGAGVSSAHASLISTTPTSGTHVDDAPSELILQLNEPVTLIDGSAQLIDGDGGVAELSDVRVEDDQRRIVLVPAAALPDAAYLATARVVSADTHVVSLSIQFTVGSVTQQGEFDSSSETEVQYLNYPSKTLAYLGLVLSAGSFLATRWVWRSSSDTARFSVVFRIGSGLLGLGLLGRLYVLISQQQSWSVLTTPHGVAILVAVAVSLTALVIRLGYLLAVAGILAVTLSGHGGSAGGWPWSFLATGVHVYGMTVWLGGLAVMLLVLRGAPDLARWHRVAAVHIGLVVLAGVILSVLQIRPLGALWGSSYGLILVSKVLVVAVAVVLGAVAYRRFSRRTLLAEIVAAVVVLGLTSILSSQAPAKDVYTTDIATSLDFGSSEVLDIGIDSIRRGPQELTLSFDGTEPATVSVDFSSVEANVARLPVVVGSGTREGSATVWRSEQLIVPAPGEWKVTVRFEGAHGPKVASFFYDAL